MADQAAIVHGCLFPESRVAGSAFITEVGMGGYPAEGWSGLCVQLPGAEKCTAANKPHPDHNQDGKQSGKNAGGGKETGPIFVYP